ncbi:hypothetical protein IFR05_012574 [Cadophora sp. M221]|nr:hypothetical protein IFR05_012574 [Cadophora sp. M221]
MTSQNTSNSDHPANILTQFLDKHQGVVIVKLFWYACDGFPYSRTLNSNRCRSIAAQNGGFTVHVSSIGGLASAPALDPAFASPVGKTTLLPDWKSLRLLSGTHAIVQCKIFENLQLYPGLMMQSPTQRCPRSCLERVIQIAGDSYGMKLLAGFETEFYLLRSTPGKDDVYSTPAYHSLLSAKDPFPLWSSASCMRGPMAKCVEECMIALEEAGIVVEQGHVAISSKFQLDHFQYWKQSMLSCVLGRSLPIPP